ncbi:MAG: alkylmercury lyase family protein [Alphaproteobacteria bacterium]|nr:alkylmercury lyase family protein [Alphaproteobacteria bacterium]
MAEHLSIDSLVHYTLIKSIIDTGKNPDISEIAQLLNVSLDDVKSSFKRLEANHGIVLHPNSYNLWVIHPFSISPTATWIQKDTHSHQGWWAPCMWCALGVASLVPGQLTIHSRIAGECEDIDIVIENGEPVYNDIFIHFAIRPKDAWQNVHHHCSMVLPFKKTQDVDDWALRHNLPKGEVISLKQTAELAKHWYGQHDRKDWQKWSIEEAVGIFNKAGLRNDFWNLDIQKGNF